MQQVHDRPSPPHLPADLIYLSLPSLDHLFGVFRTRSGHLRHLDIIACPWPARPHALLGWSGSTLFIRLLNTAGGSAGLRQTNHDLYKLSSESGLGRASLLGGGQ